MYKQLSHRARIFAIILLVLAIIFAFITIGAFFLTFAPRAGYRLPENVTAWANFGNYSSGVLGPLFSFLAFAGVLWTVWLQSKQIDSAHQQANLEEIQRVLAIVAAQIDGILSKPPSDKIEHPGLQHAPITVFTIIAAAGTAAISTPTSEAPAASQTLLIGIAKQSVTTEMSAIGLELDQLAWCLKEYETQEGSRSVVAFYKRRFAAVACWIDAIQSLDSYPFVQAVFSPHEYRKSLNSSSCKQLPPSSD